MIRIKADAQLRLQKDVDITLKNVKLKIFSQPYDEVLLVTDRRYRHYKANDDRIIFEDGILFRKYGGKLAPGEILPDSHTKTNREWSAPHPTREIW